MSKDDRLARLLDNWPAKVLSFAAALALFFFNRVNRLEEKTLRVQLVPSLNEEYVPSSEYPQTVTVTLRGERGELAQVDESDLVAVLDLSGFRAEGTFRAPVTVTRSAAAERIEPLQFMLPEAEIAVSMERKMTRTVPVEPVFKGYLESGYELERIELVPDRVEISGPRSVVQTIQSVGTEVIELTGRKGDFQVVSRLQKKDQLIRIAGPAEISLVAEVRQSRTVRFFDGVRIAAVNVRPGFSFSFRPERGTMTLSGPQLELDALVAESLVIAVDVGSIGEQGEFELPLSAEPPSGFALEGFAPAYVVVTVRREE